MMRFGRFFAVACALFAASAIVPHVDAGNAATGAARDGGGPATAPVAVDHSQTPLVVRNHAAKLVSAMAGSQHLRLAVGIRLRDAVGAEKFNAALQDKTSPMFHKYLTAAQWNARFGPTAADEQAVVSWAQANGLTVTHRYPNRLLVDLDGTVAQVNAALHLTINQYSYNGRSVYSNDRDPTLPSSISAIVTSVDGLNDVATLSTAAPARNLAAQKLYAPGPVVQSGAGAHADAKTSPAAAGPRISNGSYDPTDIYSSQAYDANALYHESSCCNPLNNANVTPPQTTIAITTVGSQAVSDMQGFQAAYPYLAYHFQEINIDGTPSCCDGEGTMDLEWSTALSNSFGSFVNTSMVYMYDGVNAQISTFNDMFNQILTDGHARIVSSSWGCAEITCYTASSMTTNHNIFNAMIGQGYTLVNASDDHGAYADCTSTKRVQYPASDSDFLAISATNLELTSGPVYQSEGAWQGNSAGCSNNGGGGGGGCSVQFAAPSYQLSPSNPNYFCGTANGFSSNFKTVPDVSLNGDWLNSPQNLFFNGSFQGNGGTSIAAPEMAGYFAQQNSYMLTLGNICGGGSSACAPLGQGGSQLYLAAIDHAAQGKNPYYDITSGCTTNNAGPGFCGISGYDRATGWGTVNMLQLAWAINYWSMPEASPPTVSMSGPSTSGWVNAGTISWNITDNGSPPSGVAGYTANWDSDPGDQSSEATPGTGASFYSGPASAHGATSGSTSLLTGCHTLFVRAWDNIGESAVNSYGPVCYDDTAPVFTQAPTAAFVKNSTLNKSGVSVKVSWAATDTFSGVNQYLFWQSTDGGSYVELDTPPASVTSETLRLASGHTYSWAVGAYDNAGNFGGYSFSAAPQKETLTQENGPPVTYSAGWTRVALTGASGGFVDKASLAGKTASFKFNGTSVAWVATVGSAYGSATVSIDGGAATTVNTNAASTTTKKLVFTKSGLTAATHTLTITVSGTSGHPRIDVDGFVFFH